MRDFTRIAAMAAITIFASSSASIANAALSDQKKASILAAAQQIMANIATTPSVVLTTAMPTTAAASSSNIAASQSSTSGITAKAGRVVTDTMKSPLSSLSLGAGVKVANIANLPIAIKIIYGAASKAQIHSVGLEYQIGNNFRPGVSLLYGIGKKTITSAAGTAITNKEKMQAAMVDLYYVVPGKIAPYAGVSLGYAKHKLNVTDAIANSDKASYNSIAYGAGAGVSVSLTPSIGLDLGYKLTNFGFKDRVLANTGVKIEKSTLQHTINLALEVKI